MHPPHGERTGKGKPLWLRLERLTNRVAQRAAALHRATISRRAAMVMVAGSYNKTTTTRAIRAALGFPDDAWSQRNPNSGALAPRTLLRQSPFRGVHVVEVGISGPGHMTRFTEMLRPNIVVMTALGTEHMRQFPSFEALRAEKLIAVSHLRPGHRAAMNGDDPLVRAMGPEVRAQITWFGFGADCDVRAVNVEYDWPRGASFEVRTAGGSWPVRTALVGEPGVMAALAAFATARQLGREPAEIARTIASVRPTTGRMQPVVLPSGAVLLRDDFKASVDTVHKALEELGRIPAKRRIVVLGGLSYPPQPERDHYFAAGAAIARVADRAIVVGHVRTKPYWQGMRSGGMAREAFASVHSVAEAVAALPDDLGEGDVVLIKGRTPQRLARIALALQGRNVRCAISECHLDRQACDDCRRLEKGW